MKRVASLYLPDWSIDRLRRAEPALAPQPEPVPLDLAAIKAASDAEQGGKQCDAPRNSGWRPGARWARDDGGYVPGPLPGVDEATGGAGACRAGETRADVARRIAALPAHQRPPMREMGRRSEAADHPYKRLPGDEGSGATVVTVRLHGEGRRRGAGSGRRSGEREVLSPGPGEMHLRHAPPVTPAQAGVRGAAIVTAAAAPGETWMPEQVRHDGEGVVDDATQVGTLRQPPCHPGGGRDPVGTRVPLLTDVPQLNPGLRRGDGSCRENVAQAGRHCATCPAIEPRAGDASHQPPRPTLAAWNTVPSIRYPGDGPHPDGMRRRGSNDAGATVQQVAAFFDTGRSTAATVSRVCAPPASPAAPARRDAAPPLVTVRKTGSRIEVAAASPAARAIGVEAGMALTQVRAASPEVVVRDADDDGDARDLRRLAVALARRWTPTVAVADAQSLFLDLSGVAHLHGGEAAMARRIVRLLARLGIGARIAVADTAGAAWACAHHAAPGPGGVTIVPPGATLDALAPLPVAALRIEERALELLRRLGVDTVGQIAALPRAPLARRFGRAVPLRLDQASGRVAEPLDPVVPPVAIVVEQRFAEPLLTAGPIAHWIAHLVARLAETLARHGRGVRTLVLAATRVDAAVQTVRVGFARPTRAPDHLLRLLVRRIERLDPGFGIEALALHVARTDPLGAEALDGDLADGDRPDLAPLVDAIVNRIGERRLWRARAVESDVPERSVGGTAPLDPPGRDAPVPARDDVRRLDTRGRDHPWHPRWPRPTRLLRRPEPIDGVMAELPDHWPRRFTWRGVTHRIVRGDGPERITGEWWRRVAERDSVRDYFQVEDEEGRRFWLFRRGDAQRSVTGDLSWYVHGTFG